MVFPNTLSRARFSPSSNAFLRGPDAWRAAAALSRRLATPIPPAQMAMRHRDRLLALAADLVAARVGGAFWGERPALGRDRLVLSLCHPTGAASVHMSFCRAALDAASGAAIVLLHGRDPGRLHGLHVPHRRDVDPHAVLDAVAEGDLRLMVPRIDWWQDDLGLLAALRGVDFSHAGAPATADERRLRAAAEIAFATTYRDPFHDRPCDAEAAVTLLRSWRDVIERNRDIAACAGMSLWKRERIGQFFHDGRRPVRFRRSAAAAVATARRRQGAIAAWSSRMPEDLSRKAGQVGVEVLRVEDGFVRSLGLGADLLPPCSIIADASGLYLDPRGPSDLETILASTSFGAPLLDRASRLMALLRRHRISKYGPASPASLPPFPQDGRRRILVPGQVADDLSVRLGSPVIADNLALLERTRADHPEAWIVYRPHPDVDAGHRPGAVADPVALRHADVVARGGSILDLIDGVDEVHTLTSLAGFEALLRGKAVTVHGQPFYAGWGLTDDKAPPLGRRGRHLSLEALAAGTLLLYPRYIDPVTGLPCGPELLIERLGDAALWRPSVLTRLRRLQGRIRRRLSPAANPGGAGPSGAGLEGAELGSPRPSLGERGA